MDLDTTFSSYANHTPQVAPAVAKSGDFTQKISKIESPKLELVNLSAPLFKRFRADSKKNRIVRALLNLCRQYPQLVPVILGILDQWTDSVAGNLRDAFVRCLKIRAISKELFDLLLAIDHILEVCQQGGPLAEALRAGYTYRILNNLVGDNGLSNGNLVVGRFQELLAVASRYRRENVVLKIVRYLRKLCKSPQMIRIADDVLYIGKSPRMNVEKRTHQPIRSTKPAYRPTSQRSRGVSIVQYGRQSN
ncbi:MAG: hypothetical protein LW808_001880 [Verrucomicrobiota bacterium]|nr:MAG: hypothetical protein LW808_001880 [Verrucomicrobiota bacterium]